MNYHKSFNYLPGLKVHENGQQIDTLAGIPLNLTGGRTSHNLIMGRLFVDEDSNYGSSQIGELVIWEIILGETQINEVFVSNAGFSEYE